MGYDQGQLVPFGSGLDILLMYMSNQQRPVLVWYIEGCDNAGSGYPVASIGRSGCLACLVM